MVVLLTGKVGAATVLAGQLSWLQKWPMVLVTWQGEVSADHWLRLPHSRVQLVEVPPVQVWPALTTSKAQDVLLRRGLQVLESQWPNPLDVLVLKSRPDVLLPRGGACLRPGLQRATGAGGQALPAPHLGPLA
ncbi:unnamed protein product [Effrenium voratum]|nr:unnamed protein product [Effrenium voratum]